MEKELEDLIFLIKNASKEDKNLVAKAYDFAKAAHKDQRRKSGEAYFNHLFETAKNIAELGMDATSVAAGFLHDVIEDGNIKKEELEKEFGKEVGFIVEGVTKIGSLRYHGSNKHNESLRKLLLAIAKDLRVIIVKFCDRLHNMQTLQFIPKEKQKRIASETLEIYAPIAYRFGIRKLSRELEDLAFPYIDPEGFQEITRLIKEEYPCQLVGLEKFSKSVGKELGKAGFFDFKIDYRTKGVYSVYKKYLRNKKDFSKINDILAMRITVNRTEDCYRILGIVHGAWRPLPGRIKDYIAFPKLNGYQSLHTTVFTGDGDIVEIQIRTPEMHREAEYGVASHALYKAENDDHNKNRKELSLWIKNLNKNDIGYIKTDFLGERIFVFTPKGDVVDLPKNASVIDFAYFIHSDIGNHISGAKINGKMSSIETLLKDNDIVEIITKKSSRPSLKWLAFAKTSIARKHIRNFSS